MKISIKSIAAGLALPSILCASAALAADAHDANAAAPALGEKEDVSFRAGGDIRIRQEAFDNIPVRTAEPSVSRGGNNNYFRFRTRLNAGVDFSDAASLDVRLANEVRSRNTGLRSCEWPDELIADQLKLQLKGLFGDSVKLTIGRQDAMLGSGRIFAEGTAKDGSRTQFFDGVLANVKLADKVSLDLFGFYGKCENDLAIGNEHRDLTGYAGGFTGMDEATAGFFFQDDRADSLGYGLYYIWKHDTAWSRPAGERVPGEDIHTFGARLTPKLTDSLSAEFEGALQFGDSEEGGPSRKSYFGFGGLKCKLGENAYVSLNALVLSGDDPSTARREDFNVLYGRYPWISELMLYGFDADGVGTWNNISQCYAEAGAALLGGKAKLRVTAGPVMAPERNGAGGGDMRGWLETLYCEFPIWEEQKITGHLFLEAFQPGDYYVSDKTAYFFRWQVNIAF